MGLLERAISLTLPVVPKPVVRFFSRPYIAGTTVDDAFDVVRNLAAEGAMATLDILGEFVFNLDEAAANTEAYLDLIRRIEKEALAETHVSVKLTALGLLLDEQRCLENMRRLTLQSVASRNFVRIDMEDSDCTDETLSIYRTLRGEFGDRSIGAVLQSRLQRTLDDSVTHARPGTNFRLCKGIYLEPESIAHTNDTAIRDNFVNVLDRMFAGGVYVGVATHDEWLVERSLELIERHGLKHEQYEFQMLLGVLPSLRRRLIEAGHRLRVYVPFGKSWYAYSMRRLRENPQIAGHVVRSLLRRR